MASKANWEEFVNRAESFNVENIETSEIARLVKPIRGTSPKWEDKEWAKGQLRSHLFEVGLLLEKGDPHFENEVADLMLICNHFVEEHTIDRRFNKFVAKGMMDDSSPTS